MPAHVGRTFALLAALAAGVPGAAFAQMIAGVVYDASGAALPQVIVQAESAALIERARTVMTDRHGQYRIEDLRPGTYTVTFMREGFSTHVVESVQIASAFTASLDAELALGGVEDAVTVTADTPAVDVHRAAAATPRPTRRSAAVRR